MSQEGSVAVETYFNDNSEKTFLPSALHLHQESEILNKKSCVFCGKTNHSSNKYIKLIGPHPQKYLANRNRLCFVCLEKGHSVKFCTLSYSCKNVKATITS